MYPDPMTQEEIERDAEWLLVKIEGVIAQLRTSLGSLTKNDLQVLESCRGELTVLLLPHANHHPERSADANAQVRAALVEHAAEVHRFFRDTIAPQITANNSEDLNSKYGRDILSATAVKSIKPVSVPLDQLEKYFGSKPLEHGKYHFMCDRHESFRARGRGQGENDATVHLPLIVEIANKRGAEPDKEWTRVIWVTDGSGYLHGLHTIEENGGVLGMTLVENVARIAEDEPTSDVVLEDRSLGARIMSMLHL